jgi:hypothetical protein
MNAEELINKLSINNFEVSLEGENLRVKPASRLTPNLIIEIRSLKREIVLLLSPKCRVCGINLEIYKGALYCPLGCSQKS